MRNKFILRFGAGLTLAFATLGQVRAQAPAKQVTQDELLQQIESLKPAPTGARPIAPLPADAQRTEVRNASAPNSGQPLFAESRGEKPEKAAKRSKGPTEIEALEATFDQKAHLAVFTGEVVVTAPEFTVQADILTAYLKHDDQPAGEVAPTRLQAAPPGPKPGSKPPQKSGGLEKAIAEAQPGRVVTVIQEKNEADGTLSRSVGHGRKVHFDSVTGDITLTGRPDVQQGINTCVATDDSTIMILNRDGHMRVTGPHKTVIKDQVDLTK